MTRTWIGAIHGGNAPAVCSMEHAQEAFDGSVQGPVHHYRTVGRVVLADVFQTELLGKSEVALDRRELMQAADRVSVVEVDLRSVESAFTFLHVVGER